MEEMPRPWDYLIITATSDVQARAYESHLALRRTLGIHSEAKKVLVVADPGGMRIGTGGSTILCLMEVLNREFQAEGVQPSLGETAEEILRAKRILIVHAGGDPRGLPAYGPCGRVFIPVPGPSDCALGLTLFDRMIPSLFALPQGRPKSGQVVTVSGDVLVRFDRTEVDPPGDGLTALGALASPEAASRHGVFCAGRDGKVRLYLQRPEPAAQTRVNAVNRYGQSILDLGIMSFDVRLAMALLATFEVQPNGSGRLDWSPGIKEKILAHGLDLSREICGALGSDATAAHHLANARHSRSTWEEGALRRIFEALAGIPFHVQVLTRSSYLHFGTTREIVASGSELLQADLGVFQPGASLGINNEFSPHGEIAGPNSWVEGCRLKSTLRLGGQNVVVGVDVAGPVSLPPGACLDVPRGRDRQGQEVWFVRCYGAGDDFQQPLGPSTVFCGRPFQDWTSAVGARPEDLWDPGIPPQDRSLWNARLFPAEKEHAGYHRWLWMYDPSKVPAEQKRTYLQADRYSHAEIALLADPEAFHARRSAIRAEDIRRSLRRMFRRESAFSADDLAHALSNAPDRAAWMAELLADAQWYWGGDRGIPGIDSFTFCRIIHSLGAAIPRIAAKGTAPLSEVLPGIQEKLTGETAAWLRSAGLPTKGDVTADDWGLCARASAFQHLNETILHSILSPAGKPRNRLRVDETVWGRAPARLELGGGWTDTPPYTLEYGGTAINAAVNLNGQPPIHCYGRVIAEHVIRLSSIDVGRHIEIGSMEELLDFRKPEDPFSLVKAALAISGFCPELAGRTRSASLRKVLEDFGGGIELTTLIGIPKGSGLGTSSIIGAVVLAVIQRMMGRQPTQRELFHDVLRLEQALTTGGGWQNQIGGCVGGTKITTTEQGLFPDPQIHYVPSDILDPKLNGGSTLLYHTGSVQTKKNILEQVVGGYLNRSRSILSALAQEHQVARSIADAMARKDAALFGRSIDEAWRLQKQLCGDVTNEAIEKLLERVRPYAHGARILGAGSGGFLFMVCRSPKDAARIRTILEADPPGERSRFFDFEINQTGLEVTAC